MLEKIKQGLSPMDTAAGTALKQLLCGNEQVSDEQLAVTRNKDELQAEMAQTEQINKTMRVEYNAGERYKSYWRPTFGYAIAIT
ncbi:MAG: hypothetical protein K0S11_80 [Gammaproteobacteria bacterium]|jgi:hypothetical protein|nr:hypothetical protein [Gammaproteobacteria bacterium]